MSEKSSHSLLAIVIPALAVILGALIASGLPTITSTLLLAPHFRADAGSNNLSLNLTNDGDGAAHQVRITIVVPDNQTNFSKFTSENGTWAKSYDSTQNRTTIILTTARLSEEGIVSVKFTNSPATISVWVNSNEKGFYNTFVKSASVSTKFSPSFVITPITIAVGILVTLVSWGILTRYVSVPQSGSNLTLNLRKIASYFRRVFSGKP